MRITFKIASFIGFIISTIWLIYRPDFGSSVATISAFGVLITSFLYKNEKSAQSSQFQQVDKGGIGIQAGGNVKVNNLSKEANDDRR